MGDADRNAGPESTSFLCGRVLDAAGVPVPRAGLAVYEEGPREFSGLRLLTHASADERGEFRIEISPGPCVVVGGGTPMGPGVDPIAAVALDDLVARAAPGPGEVVEGLVVRLPFALTGFGRVAGVVRDAEGVPVEGVHVTLDGVEPTGDAWRTDRTDPGGRFEFLHTLAGTRKLGVLGTRRHVCQRHVVELPPGGDKEVPITATPRPRMGSVTMRLRCEDESGAGVPGVAITLNSDGEFEEEFVTGSDGEVVAKDLPDVLPEIHGRAIAFHDGRWAEFVQWQPPFEAWKERVVLLLKAPEPPAPSSEEPRIQPRKMGTEPRSPDAPVSGRVLDAAGAPVEGAEVSWMPAAHYVPGEMDDLRTHPVGETDAQGRFVFRGLPPGPAVFLADYNDALSMNDGAEAPTPAHAVLKEGVEVSGLELRLPFAIADLAELEIVVVDEADRPCKGVNVVPDGYLGCLRSNGCGETDAEGRIAFRVFPGKREVNVWATESHQAMRGFVDVSPGGKHELTARTPSWSGDRSLSLVVAVVDEAGAAVADAKVLLSSHGGGFGEGRTDADGRCAFPSLPVEARLQELHVSAFALGFFIGNPGATVTEWPEGRPAQARVVLIRPEHFRIRVVEKGTGRFVPGCRIETQVLYGSGWREYSEWEHDGGRDQDILPGEVTVRAHAPGYGTAERTFEVVRGGGVLLVVLEIEPLA